MLVDRSTSSDANFQQSYVSKQIHCSHYSPCISVIIPYQIIVIKLGKLGLTYNYICSRFKSTFRPFKMIIDESLVICIFRTKRRRFGLKLYVLCDCGTGFILDMVLYLGIGTDINEKKELGKSKSRSVVSTLFDPYLGKGHNLYVDK